MLYKKPSFSVPASAGNESLCQSVGQHCGPDAKGKCLRCGTPVPPEAEKEFVRRLTEVIYKQTEPVETLLGAVSERANALASAPSGIDAFYESDECECDDCKNVRNEAANPIAEECERLGVNYWTADAS